MSCHFSGHCIVFTWYVFNVTPLLTYHAPQYDVAPLSMCVPVDTFSQLREMRFESMIAGFSPIGEHWSQLGTHDEALVGRSFTWPRLHDKHLHDVTIAWHMIAWQACAWNTFEWQKYRKHDGTKPWHTLTGRRITFTWRHKYMNVTHVTPKNNYMTYDYMT